ncbi:sodium/proton antiporter, partial [Bermanella sp. 47_1433_sub80_T6]
MSSLYQNFLGNSPSWYKKSIIAFLLINPLLVMIPDIGYTVAGWALILEFIFTLALALKCYPLQPGGLLVIEAVALGMTSPVNIYNEVNANLEVILLLMFMVAGIYFMQNLLLFIFTKLLINVRS